MTTIEGQCERGFEGVREALVAGFGRFPELGASVCVVHQGETVVDLWGGFADVARQRPWQRDTISNVASAAKGAVSVIAHRLVEQGKLELDAPVARYWPEFARHGKERVTVRHLMSHQAGLPALRKDLPPGTLYDWSAMTAALADEAPWWDPGTRHGYHVVTFGFLVGEVIRRITERSVGTYLRDEVCAPWKLDLHIGLPDAAHDRVAESAPLHTPKENAFNPFTAKPDPDSILVKAFFNPADLAVPGVVNTPQWRRAEVPASNGIGNARALARLYGGLANGGVLDGERLLAPETIDLAIREQVSGTDAVLGMEDRFALGFMLPSPMRPFGPGRRSFGHSGSGGILGFADPDRRLGFGYVMNLPLAAGTGGDPRWPALIDAVYRAVS